MSHELPPLQRVVLIQKCLFFTSNSCQQLVERSHVTSSWRNTVEDYIVARPALVDASDPNFYNKDIDSEAHSMKENFHKSNNNNPNNINNTDSNYSLQQLILTATCKRILNPIYPIPNQYTAPDRFDPEAELAFTKGFFTDVLPEEIKLRESSWQAFANRFIKNNFDNHNNSYGGTDNNFTMRNADDDDNILRHVGATSASAIRFLPTDVAHFFVNQFREVESLKILRALRDCCTKALSLPTRILLAACPTLLKSAFDFKNPQDQSAGAFDPDPTPMITLQKKYFSGCFSHQQRAAVLFFACLSGDVAFVQSLRKQFGKLIRLAAVTSNPLLQEEYSSLLHEVCRRGDANMLDYLIQEFWSDNNNNNNNSNINTFNFFDHTSKSPLDLCIRRGGRAEAPRMLRSLLGKTRIEVVVPVNPRREYSKTGRSVIFTAAETPKEQGGHECLRTILQVLEERSSQRQVVEILSDPDPYSRSTPLHVAARSGDVEVLRLLVQPFLDASASDSSNANKAKLSIQKLTDSSGQSPFAVAVSSLHIEAARFLLEAEKILSSSSDIEMIHAYDNVKMNPLGMVAFSDSPSNNNNNNNPNNNKHNVKNSTRFALMKMLIEEYGAHVFDLQKYSLQTVLHLLYGNRKKQREATRGQNDTDIQGCIDYLENLPKFGTRLKKHKDGNGKIPCEYDLFSGSHKRGDDDDDDDDE